MEITALLLSRLQFAFTIMFHIIFPSFTIGLAMWLSLLEGLRLVTGRPVYRAIFDFWLKIFGLAFGLGTVSGIVMAFQFGTNWSIHAKMAGPIQGPLLMYETFTAFMLEATFLGVVVFGRNRVSPWFYWFSTAMMALGTTLSAFWILANNSWMQVPFGYALENGEFVPNDWTKILFNSVLWSRFPHMLFASYLTGAFCVAATGAWYVLRKEYHAEARIMLRMGLALAAVLMPIQLLFGHLCGEYVNTYQQSKMAAIEGRWNDEKPASEVIIAWPDEKNRRNLFAITLPAPLGSIIDADSLTAGETGLNSFPPENQPPVLIPFFSFRIMVGCGLLMLALAWVGTYLGFKGRLTRNRLLLWLTFFSFPLPFIAILTGWFTAEVGRQPWVIFGVLRTADALTPFLTTQAAMTTLVIFCAVYAFIFAFGTFYIYRLIHVGPAGNLFEAPRIAVPNRPMSLAETSTCPKGSHAGAGE
jgi:cytochrome d ubiquinol oxidase subunit I